MAVIISDMKLPKKCIWDCPLCREDGGACQLKDVKTSDLHRPSDCPLKSIDEMIAEIYECCIWSRSLGGAAISYYRVEEIINKYCKEIKND